MGGIRVGWPAWLAVLAVMACEDAPGGLKPVPVPEGGNYNPMPDSSVYLFHQLTSASPGGSCTSMVFRMPVGGRTAGDRPTANFLDSTVSRCDGAGVPYSMTRIDSVSIWESMDRLYEEIRPADTARPKELFSWPQRNFPPTTEPPHTKVVACTYRDGSLEIPCKKLSESDANFRGTVHSVSLEGIGILERGYGSYSPTFQTSGKRTLLAKVANGDTTWFRGEVFY